MSDAKLGNGVSSDATTEFSLPEILNAHARMETQCGEIYVQFAATFGQHPELRRMWTAMALEEGGHAAVVRAVSRGLLSGVLRAKSLILPLEYLDSLYAVERVSGTGTSRDLPGPGTADHLGTGMF